MTYSGSPLALLLLSTLLLNTPLPAATAANTTTTATESTHKHDTHDEHEHEHEHEQHGKHEHGTAQLTIAVDGNQIEAVFNSPMANIVGFEHAPSNEQERAKLKAAKEPLEQGLPLLSFNADANCKLTHAEITSTLFLDANYHPAPKEAQTKEPQKTHNDLAVTWNYECANAKKLANADLKFFSIFGAALEHLQVEWLTEKGASARELTQDESISF